MISDQADDVARAAIAARIDELTDLMSDPLIHLDEWGKLDTERDAMKRKLWHWGRKR